MGSSVIMLTARCADAQPGTCPMERPQEKIKAQLGRAYVDVWK